MCSLAHVVTVQCAGLPSAAAAAVCDPCEEETGAHGPAPTRQEGKEGRERRELRHGAGRRAEALLQMQQQGGSPAPDGNGVSGCWPVFCYGIVNVTPQRIRHFKYGLSARKEADLKSPSPRKLVTAPGRCSGCEIGLRTGSHPDQIGLASSVQHPFLPGPGHPLTSIPVARQCSEQTERALIQRNKTNRDSLCLWNVVGRFCRFDVGGLS